MRVLPVERLGLSLESPARGLDPDEPPLEADEPPPEDDDPPPRVTALPLPPPLGPDDRGVARCPSSEYDMPLLKPARCCGAFSRADAPEPIDGDEIALADGELKLEPPPPLEIDPPPPELATLPPPPPLEPPLPRSTAPPLLAAPLPVDRSAAPADAPPLSDGLDWPNAGAVASVKPATTIPSLKLKAFIFALLCAPRSLPLRSLGEGGKT